MNLKRTLTTVVSTAALSGTVLVAVPAFSCSRMSGVDRAPTTTSVDPSGSTTTTNTTTSGVTTTGTTTTGSTATGTTPTQTTLSSVSDFGKAGIGIVAIAALFGGGWFLKNRLARTLSANPDGTDGVTTPEAVSAETTVPENVSTEEAFTVRRFPIPVPPGALTPIQPIEAVEDELPAVK